ncbi:sensor histidine kinase [Arthrobacter sp. B10-11]|uniref:sensor histidine kinase n=1 Tax=Arthrobacter sp. B10-11 TaxID=3081160 RepID=UPI0029538197|nr:ATP-binding protein [Arthrobacter sp. B10-11]MDV8146956.1 histidine kinase [Arthrobacter sp. B10-11]
MSGDTDIRVGGPPAAGHRSTEHSEVRTAVVKFLLMGGLALVLVALPITFWIRAAAESHALNESIVVTQRLADHSAAPLITAGLLAGDPSAISDLDRMFRPWLDKEGVLRVKIWNPDGKVLYSDQKSLIGQVFGLPGPELKLLADGDARATLGRQQDQENQFESAAGELVEVYVRFAGPDGSPLILEAYYDDEPLRKAQEEVLYGVIPPFLLSLFVLQLAQLPTAVRLARKIQANRTTSHRLLKHAAEASDLERKRIARDLHDDVIQDLSGLAYALESEGLHGGGRTPVLTGAREILQRNVRKLRTMTTELYPPDLDEYGLAAALARLAGPVQDHGISLELDVPAEIELDRDQAAMLYRVARESLANVVKHSHATTVRVSMTSGPRGAEISVADDGIGFDEAQSSPEGHSGLRILRDTFRATGGTFEVRTAPGAGTTVRARLDRPAAARL